MGILIAKCFLTHNIIIHTSKIYFLLLHIALALLKTLLLDSSEKVMEIYGGPWKVMKICLESAGTMLNAVQGRLYFGILAHCNSKDNEGITV